MQSRYTGIIFALASAITLVGTGCLQSSDGSGGSGEAGLAGGSTCRQFTGLLRSCGLLSEGLFACEEPVGTQEQCEARCATSASCGDLDAVLCNNGVPGGELELARCSEACAEPASFVCDDGTRLSARDLCDGWDDCSGAEDERGCTSENTTGFTCSDGVFLFSGDRCNGFLDCNDGADEDDCPVFSCQDGSGEVPEGFRCDDEADCPDGSDELGCAQQICG